MSEWAAGTLDDVLIEVDDRNRDRGLNLILSVTERRGIIPQTEVFRKRIATEDTAKYKVIRPLDIAWNPYLLWTGAVGQWLGDAAGVTSPVYPVFRAKEDQEAKYWGLVLSSGLLTPYFDSTAMGSIQRRRRTTPPVFKSAPVSIPPQPEQRRIVDVMGAVDAHLDAVEQELSRVAALRTRTLMAAEEMRSVTVDELAVVSQGKTLPKATQGARSGDISWFKIADMTRPGNEDGYTVAETRLTAQEIADLRGAIVPAGSVVFPRVGAAVLTEKKRILDRPAAVDENHLVLIPRDGVSPECLLTAIETMRLSDLVQTGAVPSLNMSLIRAARVMWSDHANTSSHKLFVTLRQSTRETRKELATLQALRSALLGSLLTQDTEIPDSYDSLLEDAS